MGSALVAALRVTVRCILLVLVVAARSSGQEGYTLESGRAVIDSKGNWEYWQFPANTVQITDEGVLPAFIRKSTTLEIDGEELTVPGINAMLNAADFGGGILAVGSNESDALNVTDGDLSTYWEPDTPDPVRDWWIQVDLGRTVSATRIVLKFVDDDLGDPFLQFKVTTSQGETTVGPPLTRTRFTTKKPVKTERVFEIDLTKQPPTKWPNSTGGFTGDVIGYVGVVATDSDFGKGREVSQSEYESLSPDRQGDIEYFRRDASGRDLFLRGGKEDWDALEGTGRQGKVVYHRRELPKLAEIEVWSIGDNIGTGVLPRGGTVTSVDDNGTEGTLVDGHFFGEVLYWTGLGGFNPNLTAPSVPIDQERQLIIDLGGAFFLDNIRVLQQAPFTFWTNPVPEYRIQLSDGSTNAGGALEWQTVAAIADLDISTTSTSQRYNNFEFPLTKAKFFSFTYRLWPNDGSGAVIYADSFALSEIQFFGEGFMPESRIESVFEGEPPYIELGRLPQNLSTIEWDADTPPGTQLILQTRSGDTVEKITHYYKKNGEEYPGTEEEAAEAHASDKKFFGENSVGPVVVETVPGPDWSGWSQPYFQSGEKITSPSPRKFVAVRATFLTDDPTAAVTLRSLALNFVTPVAGTIVGEVLPSRLEEIGRRKELSYFLRSTFDSGSRGFDEVLLQAPDGVEMSLTQVHVSVDGQEALTYTVDSEGFEVVRNESDSLWVRFPEAIKTTSGSVLVEVEFEATIFGYNTYFIGSTGHSEFENSWQRVEDGDANGVNDSETTVVLALEPGDLLGDLEIDGSFTPNGDGVNDAMEVAYSLMRVGRAAPVRVEVYDLSGRLVSRLSEESKGAGRHAVTWTGTDRSGALVPPGIYLVRIDLEVDAKSEKNSSVHRLVHLAY